MSCVLRAGGREFDVDGFVASSALLADSFWRRGEFRSPHSSHGRVNASSGLRVVVSDAAFSEFPRQVEDVSVFLSRHWGAIHSLVGYPGVEDVELDFGVETSPPSWCSFRFPPELLRLAGDAGVTIVLSAYPREADEG